MPIKNLATRLTAVVASTTLVVAFAPTAQASTTSAKTFTENGLEYIVDPDGSAAVTGVVDESVTSISVPGTLGGHTVKRVSTEAFVHCRGLEELTLPKTLEKLALSANANAYTGLWDVYSVQNINVESGCKHFCSEDGILYNADKTVLVSFPGANRNTNYSVPEGVKEIGMNGLQPARSLVSLSLPSTLKTRSENFLGCRSLESFTVSESNPTLKAVDGVLYSKDGTSLISYPDARAEASYSIAKGTKVVQTRAIELVKHLEKVTIPSSVTSIGELNFADCDSLKSIEVESGNKSYKSDGGILFDKAMRTLIAYPTGLTSAHYRIPVSVKTLSSWAFSNARTEALSVPSSVKDFENHCLVSYFIKTIYVETSSQYKTLTGGSGLYDYVYSKDSVVLTETKTGIISTTSDEKLQKGDTVTVPSAYGEAKLTVLSSKVAKNELDSLSTKKGPSYAGTVRVDYYPTGRGGIVNLKALRYNFQYYKITEIAPKAFQGRKNVHSLALANISKVGASSFQGCANLKTASLGSSLNTIGSNAFQGCKSLGKMRIASSRLKSGKVGASALKGTSKKMTVTVPKAKLGSYKSLLRKAGASGKARFVKA